MEDFDTERRNFRTKTPISSEVIAQIDSYYHGGLTDWKSRYLPLVTRQPKKIEFLHIAVTQLYESARLGCPDALDILDEVIACTSANQCHQILCPAVEQDANELPPLMDAFRNNFWYKLRDNAKKLGTDTHSFKMMGAFEIDLKNTATQSDASLASQDLIKQLGYVPRLRQSQYLLHLHAIVGPLNDERKGFLRGLIERSLGVPLLSHQLDFRWHETKPKDDNLRNLASYMFKAKLQFADNIFDDNHMQKQTRYHTPYKGKVLVDYLKVVNDMQNFKGLKFDFGV